MVCGTQIVLFQRLHHFHDHGGQRQLRAHAVGGIEDIGQILDMQIDTETGFEIAIQHHRRFRVQYGAAGQAGRRGWLDKPFTDP